MACNCTKKKVPVTKKVTKEPSVSSRKPATQPRRVVRRIMR